MGFHVPSGTHSDLVEHDSNSKSTSLPPEASHISLKQTPQAWKSCGQNLKGSKFRMAGTTMRHHQMAASDKLVQSHNKHGGSRKSGPGLGLRIARDVLFKHDCLQPLLAQRQQRQVAACQVQCAAGAPLASRGRVAFNCVQDAVVLACEHENHRWKSCSNSSVQRLGVSHALVGETQQQPHRAAGGSGVGSAIRPALSSSGFTLSVSPVSKS